MAQKPIRILILGFTESGKDELIEHYAGQQENLTETIGIDFRTKFLDIEGKKIKIQLWTTAGQEKFREFDNKTMFRSSNAVAFIFDTSNRDSFDRIKAWTKSFRNIVDPPLDAILIGNKCGTECLVTKDEVEEIAKLYNMRYFETSVESNYENANEAFDFLATEVYKHH